MLIDHAPRLIARLPQVAGWRLLLLTRVGSLVQFIRRYALVGGRR